MARIEKTVFISYRRTDVYTALAVYQDLKNQGYDIFFDYRSISSGAFEQIIISNIKARAHFLLILTPTALDRCNEPGDWLRREIETAIDEKRNIIPLLFKGFQFGIPSLSEKLTGKLQGLSGYNGLNVHEDYFDEAMYRLRTQYLNSPLNTVLHPVSTLVQNAVKEEQVAADEALTKDEEVKELVKQAKIKTPSKREKKPSGLMNSSGSIGRDKVLSGMNIRLMGGIVGGLLLIMLLVWGGMKLFNSTLMNVPESTQTLQLAQSQVLQPEITNISSPTETPTPDVTHISSPTETSVPVTPTLGIGSTRISDKDGMTLLYVTAGEFTMGSDTGSVDEMPAHMVYLDSFWIDQTEVTNALYTLCVDHGSCQTPRDTDHFTNGGYAQHPVVYVSWNDANDYCSWADRRLPTEAEWEKAARGTEGLIYPWGNKAPDSELLNYNAEIMESTEVGNYPKGVSPYGAYDMLGNVWEWVNDWYGETFYQISPASNPLGPDFGISRVHRGGSWLDDINFIRSSKRDKGDPNYAYRNLGFRCAMDATP